MTETGFNPCVEISRSKPTHFLASLVGLLAICGSVQAAIAIHGSTTGYTDTSGDWLTLTGNDIDSATSTGLGTDGWLFFGDFNGAQANSQPFTHQVSSLPGYVSAVSPGADFVSVAAEFPPYGQIDNPLTLDGTNNRGGFALGTAGAAGNVLETVTFTVGPLTNPNQVIRVGVLAGLEGNGDGRWDPTSIGLSDGTTTLTVGNHTTSPLPANGGGSNTGWVYFDIDAAGTYSVLTSKRLNGQGTGIGGLTFDSIIPEPSRALLLLFGAGAMIFRRNR